ncbi:alphabet isoform e-related [Holotrichia oblita]|uniref:Alphabet isoform e-related n=1 Tax=Holotrichia oblita TaxID=644536 RepID=A0ACB9SJX3_HOLOL|nr:alphabet isoform e-related [Holotrichia oblita]
MPASIGVNLRVTGHCRQGGRKYMEDFFSVAYQQTEDERDLEYAFFGIYDGHGGAEAAAFAKERLMETIVRHKFFWSDNDEDVLRAIKLGYIATHYAMWKEQEKWPKTASGLPSTAGTTASIAFIRKGKIYVGHVGDSAIVLGYQEPGCPTWKAKPLTRDHKPESASEMSRIEQCGGKVVSKSGVPRVVWNRPRIGHKGPVRRSTPIDEIPFLAVARSLGDLWSYNSELDEFVVSPDPDCSVIPIDTTAFRCLIFGTDGLYNMLSPQMAVHIVQQAEKHNEEAALCDALSKIWINPSKCLVERALKLWSTTKMRADNTSVVTLMLDPPGPPRAQVLRNRKKAYPDSGLQIMTRYQNESQNQLKENSESPEKPTNTIPEHNPQILKPITSYRTSLPLSEDTTKDLDEASSSLSTENHNKKTYVLKPRASLTFDPNSASTWGPHPSKPVESIENTAEKSTDLKDKEMVEDLNESKEERCSNCKKVSADDVSISSSEASSSDTSKLNNSEENIQINEISSSSNELEDEEIARLKPENFNKGNFRRCKSRSSLRKVVKKPDKLEAGGSHGRKRCLSEPSESNIIKKARMCTPNADLEQMRHNLRIRKVNTVENVVKKNEEMVNQVDSTNKEVKKRRGKTANRNSIDVDITKARQTRFSSKNNIRKSQRLKSKSNLSKLVDKIKNKANKMKKVNKKILLVRKKANTTAKQRNLRKPNSNSNNHHQRREAVTSSNKSPSSILKSASLSNCKVKDKILKRPTVKQVKQVCVTSSSIKKPKSERTFKMGYVGKLRQNTTARRNQKK